MLRTPNITPNSGLILCNWHRIENETLAVEMNVSDDSLNVTLDDGRAVSVPLAWFPRLLNATARQRKRWELLGGGVGIHCDDVDEDISVASLLQPERFMRMSEEFDGTLKSIRKSTQHRAVQRHATARTRRPLPSRT
jgi:hypothetical protein